jgi:hypothetical protein
MLPHIRPQVHAMILHKLRIPPTDSLRVWLLGDEAVEVAATGDEFYSHLQC